jgi:hypothetical protein
MTLLLICERIGVTTSDGKLMACFRSTRTRQTVYFLFDPATRMLCECDCNGAPSSSWQMVQPQTFVQSRCRSAVNAAKYMHVFGRPLTAYYREFFADDYYYYCY